MPGSLSLYPDALPARINPNGFGRNMSLFLVMKRYDMSLKDFLCQHPPNTKIAIMLLTQLLEAVTHMVSNGVAHRDLKADNILLDLDESDTMCPTLAVTDFGCCLADQVYGLSLHYTTPDTDKGGNAALMAPEVACAEPGPFTYINYNKADVWAVGTLAYQLFGMDNPFHRISNNQGLSGTGTKFLLSATYTESELPPFPETVPSIISKLVMEMLMRNPSRILQWLFCLTTKVVSEGRRISSAKFMSDEGEPLFKAEFNSDLGHASPEYNLVESFLRRIKLSVVRDALQWINQA
ncbi:hypothetical protein FOCC_FOCC016323 [Frankliniella occidentalis]|nr:hypothetical protein FOCC_FOCC016323 [Frankliniella occidentalis]